MFVSLLAGIELTLSDGPQHIIIDEVTQCRIHFEDLFYEDDIRFTNVPSNRTSF